MTSADLGTYELMIYTHTNVLVKALNFHKEVETIYQKIDISDLRVGAYILSVKINNSKFISRFIKQ
jgi:hypothetical protein